MYTCKNNVWAELLIQHRKVKYDNGMGGENEFCCRNTTCMLHVCNYIHIVFDTATTHDDL